MQAQRQAGDKLNVHSWGPSTYGTGPWPAQDSGPETGLGTCLSIAQLGQGLQPLVGLVWIFRCGAGPQPPLPSELPRGRVPSTVCNEQPGWQLKAHCLQREICKINIGMLQCGLQILQRLGEMEVGGEQEKSSFGSSVKLV